MYWAKRGKEVEASINATEKASKQRVKEEYQKQCATFEESFAKYGSDMLGDLEAQKTTSRKRNDDVTRCLSEVII